MKTNEITYIDAIIERLYNEIIELKTFIGECKGQNKAYELNRKNLVGRSDKIIVVDFNNQGDDTPMQYKNVKIKKRIDDRYEARFQKNGSRISIYGNTQLECYNKLKQAINSKKTEQKVISETKLHNWLDEWLKTYKSENKSKENEVAIRLHIKQHLDNVQLTKITAKDIQELLNKMKDKKRTSVTVYNVLNEAFECACQNKLLKENPCKYVKRPKHERDKGEAFTIEEEQLFLQNIKGHACEDIMLFLLYSGTRRTEALNVRWEDVDWKNNRLHIRGTKTEKSDRIIPIFPKLKEVLQKIGVCEKGKLFDYKDAGSVTRSFIRFSGLSENHKLHDLRHTFATRAIESQVPMKYVQAWLGHSTYKTTADIYSHVINDKLEQNFADKLQ